MMKLIGFLLLCLTAFGDQKPNVLLIAVDDLNSWTGCLGGHPDSQTPNIDCLAESGVLFTNAHSQGTMCNPSRISIIWGKRPSTSGFYSNHYPVYRQAEFLRQNTSLVKHFKNHAYTTLTCGKVFHASWIPQKEFDVVGPRPPQWQKGFDIAVNIKPRQYHATWDFGPQNYPEEQFIDYKVADWAVKQLNKNYKKPFFCALGFYRPHVPFFPPQRVFDQFENARLPEVLENDWQDIPPAAKAVTLNNAKIPTHQWMKQQGAGPWRYSPIWLVSIGWMSKSAGFWTLLKRVRTGKIPSSFFTAITVITLEKNNAGQNSLCGKIPPECPLLSGCPMV